MIPLEYLVLSGPGAGVELALLQEVAQEGYRLETFSTGDVAEAHSVARCGTASSGSAWRTRRWWSFRGAMTGSTP